MFMLIYHLHISNLKPTSGHNLYNLATHDYNTKNYVDVILMTLQ